MLVSPPFLDGKSADPFDEFYVDNLMRDTGHGHFPLSRHLAWHGGLHLQAPTDSHGARLPVRAIADGTVVLVHQPSGEPTSAADLASKCKNPNNPLAYGGQWSSDGAVVIKHKTAIGCRNNQPVMVTFYSVYQHLHTISGKVKEGEAIWRKDVIGSAGYIASEFGRIHFEIVASKTDVATLIGRDSNPKASWPPAAGRADCLFGTRHFAMPDGVPVYAVDPREHSEHYALKSGDTAASIAAAHHTTVQRLKQLNGKAADSDAAFNAWLQARTPGTHGSASTSYTVRAGDSLSAIAHTHHTTTAALQQLNHLASPHQIQVGQHLTLPAATTNTIKVPPSPIGHSAACLISMQLFKDSVLTTTAPGGAKAGGPVAEADYEYKLYDKATKDYPHCASAGYELLRLGRVIGPDALNSADGHAHYRQASVLMNDGTTQTGYIDLNAKGVSVYSEADFAAAQGWTLIDDDANGDARCDSPLLYGTMQLAYAQAHQAALSQQFQAAVQAAMSPKGRPLDMVTPPFVPDAPLPQLPALPDLINDPAVQARMRTMIVHSPSEWDKQLVAKRWGWLTKEKDAETLARAQTAAAKQAATPSMGPDGMLTHPGYDLFVKHVKALAFWDDGKIGLKSTDTWRFDPRQFIKTWRKCGWLHLDEMAQMMPKHPAAGVNIDWDTAAKNPRTRFGKFHSDLNKVWRRYGLCTPQRIAAFIGQAYTESILLTTTVEIGEGQGKPYEAFYGRGLMQLTWPANYASYGEFRNLPGNTSGSYVDARITRTADPQWEGAWTDSHGHVHIERKQWFPRFDPDIVATNTYDACDSACFYWVSKHFAGHRDLDRIADNGLSTDNIGHINVYVNGGGNGYEDRIRYTPYAYRVLSDSIDVTQSETLRFSKLQLSHGRWVAGPRITATINFTPQRP